MSFHVNKDPDHITSEKVKGIGPGEATRDNREMAPRRHGGMEIDQPYQVGVLHMVLVRDHLLVEGVGQEDCWQPPTKEKHQGPR